MAQDQANCELPNTITHPEKHLALFDFDGTITFRDSFRDFLKFSVNPFRYYLGFLVLLPCFLSYKAGFLSDGRAKEIVLTHFYRGWDTGRFYSMMGDYSRNRLPCILKRSALEKIREHREKGHTVVIVSAAPECMLRDWCKSENLDLIGTTLEERDGKMTGHLLSENCYGPVKVTRIREKYDLTSFNYIYAYGDSRGDREMLEIADEGFYRVFD